MLKNVDINNHDLDIYILNDQSTSCGICGARTYFEAMGNKLQLHQCLNLACGYKFMTEEIKELVPDAKSLWTPIGFF